MKLLGKKPARRDPRTLLLDKVLHRVKLPAIPKAYSFDTTHPNPSIPHPMYANDIYGDCVLAARAHATLRFEREETGELPSITDKDVVDEWHIENGGTSEGLFMLDSLKAWRKNGWVTNNHRYYSAAFAAVDPCEMELVEAGLYLFGSLQAGFSLPYAVSRDLENPSPWDIVDGPECAADPDAGHAIAIIAYNENWLTGVTWGRLQLMSWAWFEAYCDELYAVVDQLDRWRSQPGINVPLLEQYLREVAVGSGI